MPYEAYRTAYSRALFRSSRDGFVTRPLDADDYAFIESVRERGYVGGCDLGAVQGRSEYGGAYSGYWNEEDAIEAYALQAASEALRPLEQTGDTPYFSVDDSAAKKAQIEAESERKDKMLDRAFKRALKEATFAKRAKEHAEELAELERVNRQESMREQVREAETARIEFDWAAISAKIVRDRIIHEASIDRRQRRQALKAAERELQRANRELRQASGFLNRLKRRLHERNDDDGGAGHPTNQRQDQRDLGKGGSGDDINNTSSIGDQLCANDAGLASSGHFSSAPDADEDPISDGGSGAPSANPRVLVKV